MDPKDRPHTMTFAPAQRKRAFRLSAISHRAVPQPLYQQIKNIIETHIEDGTWPPDTMIPSENELSLSLKVSRMTVHRALSELTMEGRLIRIQGVGTFVAPPKPQTALFEVRSIAEEIRSRGGIHSCELLLLAEEGAPAALADIMGLAPGSPIYHSLLLHRDSAVAIQLSERFVNPVLAPEYLKQDFTSTTPSEYLLKIAPITEAEHIIEAVRPDEEIRSVLEMEADEPCLVLHRRTWVKNIVATKSRFVYPASRYKIGGRFTPQSTCGWTMFDH